MRINCEFFGHCSKIFRNRIKYILGESSQKDTLWHPRQNSPIELGSRRIVSQESSNERLKLTYLESSNVWLCYHKFRLYSQRCKHAYHKNYALLVTRYGDNNIGCVCFCSLCQIRKIDGTKAQPSDSEGSWKTEPGWPKNSKAANLIVKSIWWKVVSMSKGAVLLQIGEDCDSKTK